MLGMLRCAMHARGHWGASMALHLQHTVAQHAQHGHCTGKMLLHVGCTASAPVPFPQSTCCILMVCPPLPAHRWATYLVLRWKTSTSQKSL